MKEVTLKKYRVMFDIKKDGKLRSFAKDVYATNKAGAREIAENAWYRHYNSHMFHIEILPFSRYSDPSIKPCTNFTEIQRYTTGWGLR